MHAVFSDDQRALGSGTSNTCPATWISRSARSSTTGRFTADRTGGWIMANGWHRVFQPGEASRPDGPSGRRCFLPDDARRLLTRGSFFSPSLEGGWPLLLLFNPRRRSSSASRPVSAATSARSNAFSARKASITRFAAHRGSTVVSRGCVVGQCHRHVDSYSAVTCQ